MTFPFKLKNLQTASGTQLFYQKVKQEKQECKIDEFKNSGSSSSKNEFKHD